MNRVLSKEEEQKLLSEIPFEVRFAPDCDIMNAKTEANVASLLDKAKNGDYIAFHKLHATAFFYINTLQTLTSENMDAVRPFIRRKYCWPVLVTHGNGILEEIKSLLDRIELGRDLPFDLKRLGKTNSVPREWCFNLVREVQRFQFD